MVRACQQKTLQFHFVRMARWFSPEEGFAFITRQGKDFITAPNDNWLEALSLEGLKAKHFVHTDKLHRHPPSSCEPRATMGSWPSLQPSSSRV